MIGGLVLAAGDARRFGGPKQLAILRGRPLLEHALATMAAVPLDPFCVVVGANAQAILREVDLHGARAVYCADWDRGQSASLQAGLSAMAEADAVVVTLGDQPFLSPRAIEAVVEARGDGAAAVRATYDGVPAHPVLIERELFEPILALRGDEGARSVLGEVPVRDVPCDGLGRPDDVDTREQLEAAS